MSSGECRGKELFMDERVLIYVAGNPELYPLEYYDPESGTYRGAIPELLADFAQREGCELVYYEPGPDDRREALSGNLQADVISGVTGAESFENTVSSLTLFETNDVSYGLAFTESAPESFISALTAYAEARTTGDVTEELLAAVAVPSAGNGHALPAILTLAAALCAALAALAIVWRKGKKRVTAARVELDTDPSTGLYNQFGFEKVFNSTVNDNNRALYCMLCFHFELGHIERVGGPGEIPRFQRFAAEALKRWVSGDDIMALGSNGDFFILRQSESPQAARDWAIRVREEMRAYECAGATLNLRDISVGVFPLASREYDYESILYHARQCAISAGYNDMKAKVCGAGQCHICEEERELLADLERGLQNREFQLSLQFFVSAKDFHITGGEALSRWMHPKRGLLSADRFIPLLEREGRIDKLDFYILERACEFLQKLGEVRSEDFFISCNFSRRSFSKPGIKDQCREIIERYNFPHRELIIEITESGDIRPEEAEQMRENILAVRSLGVQVMFDDFGMGYATFHDLQVYPMDGLKLDKSLVDCMNTRQGQTIMEGIVRTGHNLGLVILAEGVEEEWQVEKLQKLNCDILQGYLFYVPLPAAEALRQAADPK